MAQTLNIADVLMAAAKSWDILVQRAGNGCYWSQWKAKQKTKWPSKPAIAFTLQANDISPFVSCLEQMCFLPMKNQLSRAWCEGADSVSVFFF
jgi:hypothetical protein